MWVRKWVDYSSKYGLGYLLSNGSTGVFFNDSTKIVLHPKGKLLFNNFLLIKIKYNFFLSYFEYMEKRPSDR